MLTLRKYCSKQMAALQVFWPLQSLGRSYLSPITNRWFYYHRTRETHFSQARKSKKCKARTPKRQNYGGKKGVFSVYLFIRIIRFI